MSNIVSRVKDYIDFKGLSVRKFEELVGFSNGAFATQYKNNKSIGSDKIENILQSFPELNAEWLLTGKGPMLKNKEIVETPRVEIIKPLKVEGRDEMVMPIMDFKYDDALFLKLLKGESLTLNKNYYIAMGDNTTNSLDSRFFGYVAEDRIKGKLLLRWWPLNRLGLI